MDTEQRGLNRLAAAENKSQMTIDSLRARLKAGEISRSQVAVAALFGNEVAKEFSDFDQSKITKRRDGTPDLGSIDWVGGMEVKQELRKITLEMAEVFLADFFKRNPDFEVEKREKFIEYINQFHKMVESKEVAEDIHEAIKFIEAFAEQLADPKLYPEKSQLWYRGGDENDFYDDTFPASFILHSIARALDSYTVTNEKEKSSAIANAESNLALGYETYLRILAQNIREGGEDAPDRVTFQQDKLVSLLSLSYDLVQSGNEQSLREAVDSKIIEDIRKWSSLE